MPLPCMTLTKMTTMAMELTTDALIDAVTREVLAALAAQAGCDCSDPACEGACAAYCADKVRGVVSTGAAWIP